MIPQICQMSNRQLAFNRVPSERLTEDVWLGLARFDIMRPVLVLWFALSGYVVQRMMPSRFRLKPDLTTGFDGLRRRS